MNLRSLIYRASWLGLLALACIPAIAQAEEPAKSDGQLPLLFDEDNQSFPLDRFKTVRQGASDWQMGKRWTWQETIQLVRPQQIGTRAELTADLEFLPLAKDGDKAETRLGFVFVDGQIGSVAFVRERKKGNTSGEIRLLREMEHPRPLSVMVRSFPQEGDLASGAYRIHVRCGAVRIIRDNKELGCGSFESHFAPAAGFVIAQESGQTACRRLTLRGGAFPPPFTPEQQNLLKKASALNEEGKNLFGEKKLDEALAKTKGALELYRQAHADKHNDVANSLHNVATVLRNMEQTAEAIPFYEEAILVRSQLFGQDHPDVALLEMELTSLLVGRQKLAEAFPHCLRAHASFSAFYGPENKHTIATQKLLEKLPRPKNPDET